MSRRTLLVCALAALPLGAGAGAVAGAPGADGEGQRARRGGKVVRVERTRARARRYPRALQGQSQTRLTAYGWEPTEGTEVVLLDHQGVMARATVTAVAERQVVCQSALYDVDIQVDHWDRQFNYGMFGVAGTDVADDAKVIQKAYTAPSGKPNEYVWVGFDRDGNGAEDMLVTSYPCADTEPANPVGGASSPHCIDAYVRSDADAEWQAASHDIFYQCR